MNVEGAINSTTSRRRARPSSHTDFLQAGHGLPEEGGLGQGRLDAWPAPRSSRPSSRTTGSSAATRSSSRRARRRCPGRRRRSRSRSASRPIPNYADCYMLLGERLPLHGRRAEGARELQQGRRARPGQHRVLHDARRPLHRLGYTRRPSRPQGGQGVRQARQARTRRRRKPSTTCTCCSREVYQERDSHARDGHRARGGQGGRRRVARRRAGAGADPLEPREHVRRAQTAALRRGHHDAQRLQPPRVQGRQGGVVQDRVRGDPGARDRSSGGPCSSGRRVYWRAARRAPFRCRCPERFPGSAAGLPGWAEGRKSYGSCGASESSRGGSRLAGARRGAGARGSPRRPTPPRRRPTTSGWGACWSTSSSTP